MKYSRLLPALCGLLLLGAGCGASSGSPTGATSESEAYSDTSAVATGSSANSFCNHPYYPLAQGTKATFKTQMAGRENTHSYEVTATTADSATLTYNFGPTLQLTSELTCADGGVRAEAYMNMGSAMSGGQITSRTLSSSGDILPQDLHVGSVWNSQYEVETQNNMPEAARLGMTTGHMKLSTTSTALGEESVTVPAGTFTAIKIEAKMLSQMKLGTNIPLVTTKTTSYSWVARGKGVVKTETTDDRGNVTKTEATEIVTP